jgi:ribonuclease III
VFNVGASVDGEIIAEATAYNKKDASQVAAKIAIEKLGITEESI